MLLLPEIVSNQYFRDQCSRNLCHQFLSTHAFLTGTEKNMEKYP